MVGFGLVRVWCFGKDASKTICQSQVDESGEKPEKSIACRVELISNGREERSKRREGDLRARARGGDACLYVGRGRSAISK